MFEKILSKIGTTLPKHNLPYMIIGGQAVLIYGEPRITRDIDITLGVNIDQLKKLLVAVKDLALKPIPQDVDSFVTQTMVLPTIDESTGIRVDFIFSCTPYENQAIKRSRKILLRNREVNFASPEDVIIHKIFAGRPRDLEDVRSVVLKNQDIDIRYIRSWLKKFESSSDKKNLMNTFNKLLRVHEQPKSQKHKNRK
jgi:hypothetical protein